MSRFNPEVLTPALLRDSLPSQFGTSQTPRDALKSERPQPESSL